MASPPPRTSTSRCVCTSPRPRSLRLTAPVSSPPTHPRPPKTRNSRPAIARIATMLCSFSTRSTPTPRPRPRAAVRPVPLTPRRPPQAQAPLRPSPVLPPIRPSAPAREQQARGTVPPVRAQPEQLPAQAQMPRPSLRPRPQRPSPSSTFSTRSPSARLLLRPLPVAQERARPDVLRAHSVGARAGRA